MFQVSKLLNSKVSSTTRSEFSRSTVQLVDKVEIHKLVCVVHRDAKLQQAVRL